MGPLNDLWRWNPTAGRWTWLKGSTSMSQTSNGVYGTFSVPDVANTPSARSSTTMSFNPVTGTLMLFGGMATFGTSHALF